MPYTLGAIGDKVRARIRDTAYPSDQIANFINDTQNDIFNEYKLPFMEASTNFVLTIGNNDIGATTTLDSVNFVEAVDATITTSGSQKHLPFIDVNELDEMTPGHGAAGLYPNGTPDVIYRYGTTLRVYPAPDKAYTVRLRYIKKPTQLAGDGVIPELPSQFEELLVLGAAYRILQVKDNYDQAGVLQNKYDEILQKLVMTYSRYQIGAPTKLRVNRRRAGRTSF